MVAAHAYPTTEHAAAAEVAATFFAARPGADAVLLTNSCARGKATPDSCLDLLAVAASPAAVPALEDAWATHHAADPAYARLRAAGEFAVVHLDVVDGRYAPPNHPADEYPDDFEIAIGNHLVYAVPLWERGNRYAGLRAAWLPYYGDGLRAQRRSEVRACCVAALDRLPGYVARGLPFAAFDHLYTAFRCFLQVLFIDRRVYPIAYAKWIHEQVAEILGLPELYAALVHLFEIGDFAGDDVVGKARDLRVLLDRYVVA